MPKRNVYVSEELDELIASAETPVPLARIFDEAVQTFLSTKICPTCGSTAKVRIRRRPPTEEVQPDPVRAKKRKVKVRR